MLAVVELDKSILAVDVMQQLQGRLVWGHHVTEVACLLLGKECVMNILRECKVAWEWLHALEEARNNNQPNIKMSIGNSCRCWTSSVRR